MHPEDAAQRIRNLPQGAEVFNAADNRLDQVRRSARRGLELAKARANRTWVPASLQLAQAFDLLIGNRWIDPKNLDPLGLGLGEAIHADDDLLATLNLLLVTVGA